MLSSCKAGADPRLFRVRTSHVLTVVAAAVALSACTSASAFDVKSTVNGAANTKIGTITLNTGTGTSSNHLTGKFEFTNPYGSLDQCYEFKWVNIINKVGANSSLFDEYPAIDPQAPPKNAAEDTAPFYYNDTTEWGPGTFGAETIRQDGAFSMFSDSPFRVTPNGWTFKTYLVAQMTGSTAKEFCVLSGFSWSYAGGTDNQTDPGVSTAGSELSVTQAAIDEINTAMDTARGDDVGPTRPMADWVAMKDCNLVCVPEASTLVGIVSYASLGLVLMRRRRAA